MPKDRYKDEYPFAKGWASVTQALGVKSKPQLYGWYGKWGNTECRRIMTQSQMIGHLADDYRDSYFGDNNCMLDLRPLHDDSKKYFKQVKENIDKFHEHYKPKRIMTQVVVYSPTKKFIGSFDDVYEIKGKLVLADGKATNSLSFEYNLQVEAYYRALKEMQDLKIVSFDGEWATKCLWVTQFPKKEKWSASKHVVKMAPDVARYQRGFLPLLTHYYYEKEVKENKKKLSSN